MTFIPLFVLIPLAGLTMGFGATSSLAGPTQMPTLKIETQPGKVSNWPLDRLTVRVKPQKITATSPHYNQSMQYLGLRLKDLLPRVGLAGPDLTEIEIQCADGYKAVLPLKWLEEFDYYLTYTEVTNREKAPFFTRMKHGKELIHPGPFYVVATGPLAQKSFERLDWPFQVVGLRALRFEKENPEVLIHSPQASASALKGFQIFKDQCVKCHSVNLQGGLVGPELNVPQNVLEYRERKTLKAFIANPQAFRARSKMPPMGFLGEDNIQAVLDYLEAKKSEKIQLTAE